MFCFSFYAYVLFELCRKVNYYPRIFKKYNNNFIADDVNVIIKGEE